MRVQLTRFPIRHGKRPLVDEWMAWIEANHDAALETLQPERMYVESIFCDTVEGGRLPLLVHRARARR